MRHAILILALAITCLTTASAAIEDFKVYTERPRLLLNQRRLKLLRRERDRQSLRWNQFELLMKGKAALPEQPLRQRCTARYSTTWALQHGVTIRRLC